MTRGEISPRLRRVGNTCRLVERMPRLAGHTPVAGLHGIADGELLEAFDHHALAGLEAIGDQPLAIDKAAGADRLRDNAIIILDQKHFAGAG